MERTPIEQSIVKAFMPKLKPILAAFIAFTGYLLIGSFFQSYAQDISLRSYPSLIQIRADKDTDLNLRITIENLSAEPVSLQIQLKLFKQKDDFSGEPEYLNPNANPNQILQKIHIFEGENQITGLNLGPNQKKELDLKLNLNEADLNQDYYFSVFFLSDKITYQAPKNGNAANSFSTINAGVASNVFVSRASESDLSGSIEKFSSSKFLNSAPVDFSLKISNPGSHYIQTNGTITIKNMLGREVDKIAIPKAIILSSSSRYLTNNPQAAQAAPGDTPKISWNKKFLLGLYEAKLDTKFSDKGPVISRTIRFFVLPAPFLLLMVVITYIIILIVRRVREKMKTG